MSTSLAKVATRGVKAGIKRLIPEGSRPKAVRLRLLKKLIQDERIKAGPFEGIFFPTTTHWSGVVPKLLGVYELELYATLNAWHNLAFAHIINVGSADGYYALGCAKTWPASRIIAYETEVVGRKLLEEYALRNGFKDRIECRPTCTPLEFGKVLKETKAGLVIMDVEGYEDALLAGENVALLRHFHLIVEIHDLRVERLGEKLIARFAATHTITEIWTRRRELKDFAYPEKRVLRLYLLAQLREISNEERGAPMRWFTFEPKAAQG